MIQKKKSSINLCYDWKLKTYFFGESSNILQFLNLELTYFWDNFIQKINSDSRIVFLDSRSQWILKELTPRAKKAISHDHYYIGVLLSRQTKLIIEVEKLIFPTASASA